MKIFSTIILSAGLLSLLSSSALRAEDVAERGGNGRGGNDRGGYDRGGYDRGNYNDRRNDRGYGEGGYGGYGGYPAGYGYPAVYPAGGYVNPNPNYTPFPDDHTENSIYRENQHSGS